MGNYRNLSGCLTTECSTYSAITACRLVIIQGEGKCQTITILDKDGFPLDLTRLADLSLSLYNALDCHIADYNLTGEDVAGKLEILQEEVCTGVLHLSPQNFDKLVEEGTFYEADNVFSVTDPDLSYISLGDEDGEGVLIYHCEYNDKLYCRVVPSSANKGTVAMSVNGIPYPVVFNEPFEIYSPDDDASREITLGFVSEDEFRFNCLELTTQQTVKNKGQFQICFTNTVTGRMPSGGLKASIILTFRADDSEEPGNSYIIPCLAVATIMKNTTGKSLICNDCLTYEEIDAGNFYEEVKD